jgi:hypothetical protein
MRFRLDNLLKDIFENPGGTRTALDLVDNYEIKGRCLELATAKFAVINSRQILFNKCSAANGCQADQTDTEDHRRKRFIDRYRQCIPDDNDSNQRYQQTDLFHIFLLLDWSC